MDGSFLKLVTNNISHLNEIVCILKMVHGNIFQVPPLSS